LRFRLPWLLAKLPNSHGLTTVRLYVKKFIVIVALLLLATATFAQSSLYDLKFNDSVTATLARLKAKGFVESSKGDAYYTYKGAKDPELPTIDIFLSQDRASVISWKLSYDLKGKPDLAQFILSSLEALHNAASVIDDYDYDYIWYFPNNKALYVDYYEGDSLVLDYATGNWDDDDYYYYYDDY